MDDINPCMNHEKFNKVMNIFAEANVIPLLGVVPDNQDRTIGDCEEDSNFWMHMRELQRQHRAELAIHGLTHCYKSKDGGLLGQYGYKKQSEFAGVSYEEQYSALQKGLGIFKDHKITTNVFMAPGHTFDENTIRALKEIGITCITDGVGLFSYLCKGITLVPQQMAVPRKLPFGVITVCLHTNSMKEEAIDQIEKFVLANKSDIITFSDAREFQSKWYHTLANFVFKELYYCACKVKRRNNR